MVDEATKANNIRPAIEAEEQYTPMVPWNIRGLANVMGGDRAFIDYLDQQQAAQAWQGNEPSLEIPWEWDFAHAPWKTQARVRETQRTIYAARPAGEPGNDDLGAMGSWYVWSALGMYPVFPGSPQFPHATVHMGNGETIAIDAPGAAPDAPYVRQLKLNGRGWPKTYLPPSYSNGQDPALGFTRPSGQIVTTPGRQVTVTVGAQNVTHAPRKVSWTADVPRGCRCRRPAGGCACPRPPPAPTRPPSPSARRRAGTASGSSWPRTTAASCLTSCSTLR